MAAMAAAGPPQLLPWLAGQVAGLTDPGDREREPPCLPGRQQAEPTFSLPGRRLAGSPARRLQPDHSWGRGLAAGWAARTENCARAADRRPGAPATNPRPRRCSTPGLQGQVTGGASAEWAIDPAGDSAELSDALTFFSVEDKGPC